jgi:hypothetical protein
MDLQQYGLLFTAKSLSMDCSNRFSLLQLRNKNNGTLEWQV